MSEPRAVATGLFNNADLSKTQGRSLPLAVLKLPPMQIVLLTELILTA